MDPEKRAKVIDLIRKMLDHTVDRGCTPGEAAKFAAKAAELMEKYQIEEAELRVKEGKEAFTPEDVNGVQNWLRTGKKAFNPGVTQVVGALARGMCCEYILSHRGDEAVYGIVGDQIDADLVCQLATTVVPALRVMAAMEGAEHGYEKAGLIRWTNQYLMGAATEIYHRLTKDRRNRAAEKRTEEHYHPTGALVLVTGEDIALIKTLVVGDLFKQLYPKTRKVHTRSEYIGAANERGREAGRRVGLNVCIEGSECNGSSGNLN